MNIFELVLIHNISQHFVDPVLCTILKLLQIQSKNRTSLLR